MKQLKIKDIPCNERPREKMSIYGVESLGNSELLAILLGSGSKKENVLQLSSRVLKEFGGLNNVFSASKEELTEIQGIGIAKASQLIALSELCKRYRSYKSKEKIKITEPKDIVENFMEEMRVYSKEILKLLVLNTKKEIVTARDISIGTNNSALIHPREVFNLAIKNCGDSIILIHNHPSGDPKPSKNDINVTLRLKECGKLLGIELIDHIIIGDRKFTSMKEKGFV